MRLIRLLLKNSWRAVILAAIAGFLSGVGNVGLIVLINFSLQHINVDKRPLIWGFVTLCLLVLVTTIIAQIAISRLTQKIVFNLRLDLIQRLLDCPLLPLEGIGSSRLFATLTEDVLAISNVSSLLANLSVDIAMIGGCLIYLSWLSLPLFFLLVGLIIIGISIYQKLERQGKQSFKRAREVQDQLFKHFRTATGGIKELKLHQRRRQAFLYEDVRMTAAKLRHHQIKGATVFALAGSWALVMVFIPIGLLIFGLPYFTTTMSAEVLSSYILTFIFMLSPLNSILNAVPRLSRANIALEKIDSLGLSLASQTSKITLGIDNIRQYDKGQAAIPVKADQSGSDRLETLIESQSGYSSMYPSPLSTETDSTIDWQTLTLSGVTHAYHREREDSRFMLGPINLTFHPGEILFIVGGNGSGKSTLVKLITGLYIPATGRIQLDDCDITDRNREWYRQQFSAVFSDFYLFDRLLGLDKPNLDSQAQAYLNQLQLDHKVQVKAGVLSTTALSQGQRKRLALLTAYLENRPVYVFDEWASDQDPLFKKIFYTQLLPDLKTQGKVVLVVSHDDRYFHLANRIVKIDYGQVVADYST